MTKQTSPFWIAPFFFFILFIISLGVYYFITRKQQEANSVLGNKEDMVGILNIVSPLKLLLLPHLQ